jgi:hypothetical protein
MRELLKTFGALLLIFLLIAHIFLVALFLVPADKLLAAIVESDSGFINAEEVPKQVETFIKVNNIVVLGDYQPNSESIKSQLIMGLLELRQTRFMNDTEKLALNLNLLNFGEGIVGLKSASRYYYMKPLETLSDKDWINLVNLQKIFSKN